MSPAQVIDTSANDATIHLEASRARTLFPNDCRTLRWDVEHIQAMYVNGEGRPGVGSEETCHTSAAFRIDLPDGTTRSYALEAHPWFASAQNRWLLLVLSFAAGIGLVLVGWLPGPRRLWADSALLWGDVKRFGRGVRASGRLHLVLLLVIMLAGAGIRLSFLGHEMTIDEVETFNHYAGQPLSYGLTHYDDPNNHLLNTLLVHVSFRLFGIDPWWLRLPVLVAGILTLPAVYVLARLFYDERAALLATALMAVAWHQVFMSTNIRGYILQTLLFLIALAAAWVLLRRDNSAAWSVFAISTALAVFALPSAVYGFAGMAGWLLVSSLMVRQGRSLKLRHLLVYSGIAGWLSLVCYAPTLARLGLTPITHNQYVRSLSLRAVLEGLPASLHETLTQWNWAEPGVLGWLLVAGCAVALALHWRIVREDGHADAQRRVPVAVPLVIMPLPIVLVQHVVPYARVWTYLQPVYLILAAAGILALAKPVQRRWQHAPAAITVVLLAFGLGWYATQSRPASSPNHTLVDRGLSRKRPYENVTAALKDELRAGDTLISYNPVRESLIYYFRVYDISNLYFYGGDLDQFDRLLVGVEANLQTLDWVLDRVAGVQLVPGAEPLLVARSGPIRVYALDAQDVRPN